MRPRSFVRRARGVSVACACVLLALPLAGSGQEKSAAKPGAPATRKTAVATGKATKTTAVATGKTTKSTGVTTPLAVKASASRGGAMTGAKANAAKADTTKATARPVGNPFARLKVVVPRGKLPPLSSVRFRDERERADRSRVGGIRVIVNSRPRGARVNHGRKVLGVTPLTITAHRNSTPLDITLRAGGYMTLRTRIQRLDSRTYFFKLNPAKIR